MRIDEAGEHAGPLGVDDERVFGQLDVGGQIGLRPNPDDATIPRGEGSALDDAEAARRTHRDEFAGAAHQHIAADLHDAARFSRRPRRRGTTSLGAEATGIPADSSAAFLSAAVPAGPSMMAPA